VSGRGRWSAVRDPLLLVGGTVVVSLAWAGLGLPSPVLFGSLLTGLAHALLAPRLLGPRCTGGPVRPLTLPPWLFRVGQAVVGVTIGAMISVEALGRMLEDAAAIVAVTLGTLLLSLGGGLLLARRPDVSPVTGTFALVAGGASGVVSVAHDLGADDRVVTVVQYLRVLVVLLSLPVVVTLVFDPRRGQGEMVLPDTALGTDLAFAVLAIALGLLLARWVPVPTAALLGPLVAGAVLAGSGWLGEVVVPQPVQWAGYALIGVQVGLRFTRDSLASIARMLPLVLALIVALIVSCGGLAALLAWLTPVDGYTAYLATTPGGLFAVLATAADTGVDVTYVMAVQLFRLLVILLLTPVVARRLGGAGGRGGPGGLGRRSAG